MPTLYFIFGHLLGDFILQPNELLKWKFREWQGILFHSVIHFLVYLLVFFPYLPGLTVFLAILGVTSAHFVIDLVKVNTEKRGRKFRFYFILDQLAHLGIMMAAGCILAGLQPHFVMMSPFSILYDDPFIVTGLALLVFFTYFLELWIFQGKREKKAGITFKPDYECMLKRAAMFTAAYGAIMILGVYKVAAMG
jgi:hypothetical protein